MDAESPLCPATPSWRERGRRRARAVLRRVSARTVGIDPRRFALAVSAGVLLVHQLDRLPGAALCAVAALPALLPWRWRADYSGFALGLLLAVLHAQHWLAQRWPEARQNEEMLLRGQIVSLPEQDADAQRFLFAPSATGDGAALSAEVPRTIRVGWYHSGANASANANADANASSSREPAPALHGGACWQLRLRLRAPRGSANPGGFDYEAWLYRQDIQALATVREGQPCAQAAPALALLVLRDRLRAQFRAWLPEAPARGLIAGLTIGDQSDIAAADWDVFRRTGTSHLVAVSGFNVAIIAGVVFFALRWGWALWPRLCLWWPAQRAAAAGAAIAAVGYAALAGFEAPVARATWMVLGAWLVSLLWRRPAPSKIFALAWCAVLLSEPAAVLSPGVWLSFGAVAAIAYCLGGRPYRFTAPPAWREAMRLQCMLSLLLAPLSLYEFGGLSWIAPLVNLLAVPVVAVLTPALLAVLLLAWLWPGPGLWLLQQAALLVESAQRGLAGLAQLTPQAWLAWTPTPLALLLGALGAVLVLAPRGLPLRGLGVILCAALLLPAAAAPPQGARFAVLDVGQGLSVVVQTARHVLVFDTGPAYGEGYDAGRSVLVPYLSAVGLRRVDVLMISHADLDHRGGAAALRAAFPVQQAYGALSSQPCRDGQHWRWDGVDFMVLHPDSDAWTRNNGACVLRIAAGAHAVLLPADIERPAEQRLLLSHAADLRAEVLLAPHHGSASSSGADFLAAVAPQTVIFPAAYGNAYRHPRAEVVARYRAAGSALEMTGAAGALLFDLDARRGVSGLRRWREQAPRFWRAPTLPVQGR